MAMTQNVSTEQSNAFRWPLALCEICMCSKFSAYLLPRVFYGEQIQLGMEGPFLSDDNNDTTNQLTIKLMGGSRAIDVS